MRRLSRTLSGTFISLMVLLGAFGLGLWALGKIAVIAGRSSATAPVASGAMRYRRFATTGQ